MCALARGINIFGKLLVALRFRCPLDICLVDGNTKNGSDLGLKLKYFANGEVAKN